MGNSIKIILIIVILVVIGGIFYVKRNEIVPSLILSPSVSLTSTPTPTPRPISDMIQVDNPKPDDTIKPGKSLVIEGKARGNWYFEATFPVKLIDTYGNLLSQDFITASGSWMTDDFVPFKKELNFSSPTTLTGTLILQKDNPSGLEELDQQIEIPIKFDIPTTTVKVFFGNSIKNPNANDCSLVYAVSRTVAKTNEVARASLEELLGGISQEEKDSGYFTSMNAGVKIKSLTITKGVAKVNFDNMLEQNIGGSCRVAAIQAQITQTLKQFSTVKTVIISIDGRTEDILQP